MAIVEHILAVPTWAERITVQRDGETLVVHGEGRIAGPVSAALDAIDRDLLQQYTRYAKLGSGKRLGKNAPHIQFANCRSDEELIAFVETFGPVLASRIQFHPALKTITACQSIDDLRRERMIFAGAAKLVAQFGNGKKGESAVISQGLAEVCEGAWLPGLKEVLQTGPPIRTVPWYGFEIMTLASRIAQEQQCDDPSRSMPSFIKTLQGGAARLYARQVLCVLLNHFAPCLMPFSNRIIELPRREPGGILPVLYFMLRQDCMRDQAIAICAQRDCGAFFEVERFGQRFCSEDCSRLERQREYWNRKGRATRQERLSKVRRARRGR